MKIDELRFFNPFAEVTVKVNRLPHWQQRGAVYFVTLHLGDAIPKQLRDQWTLERAAWLTHHPQPWHADTEKEYHRRFSRAIERWLDAGHGSCALRRPPCREFVEEALRHFDGSRCMQIAWVIMPTHLHVLFVLNPSWTLEKLIHSWKRHSALEINRMLSREGGFWQKDYFDRLVRDQDHFANCVRYIRGNPSKAKLREGEYTVFESDLVRGIP